MITQDDRTPEQRETHYMAVVARDNFMSSWGEAANGYSRAAWACNDMDLVDQIEREIRDRDEMRHVNVVDLRTYRPPRGTAHFHIYVRTKEKK